MGKKVDIDPEVLFDLGMRGLTQKQASEELGICESTLSRRLADIQKKQGLLMKYRALQSLQLTELQARVLEAITPEKIMLAHLKDLIQAFRILKDKELVIDGKPSEIRGLVGYLVEMEKREFAQKNKVIDGEFEVIEETKPVVITKAVVDITDEEYLPNL